MTKTKKQREAKAILKLEKVLWKKDFKEYKKLILEYENKSSLEAEFVYELDKLQPMIQIVMEWWSTWKNYKINKEKLMKDKYKKITNKFWFRDILRRYERLAEEKDVFYF